MSDSKQSFTPGPWTWGRRPSGYCEALIGNGEDVFRVDEYAGAAWIDVSDDNARLISAAPDLLEALTDCVALLEVLKEEWVDYDHVFSTGVHDAKAAIAKAGG